MRVAIQDKLKICMYTRVDLVTGKEKSKENVDTVLEVERQRSLEQVVQVA